MKANISILRFILLTAALVCPVTLTAQEKLPDSDPKLTSETTYKMPQSAIDAEIDGNVTIAIRVDKTGKPKKAIVAGGLMWPCSANPVKELNNLFSDLSDAMLNLQFSPAIKDGKPVENDIGLTFLLKNPRVEIPSNIDPITKERRIRIVSGGILNGKATYLPQPAYPVEAKIDRVVGSVTIQVLIDEQGKVIRAGTVNGPNILQPGARASACGAKFPLTILSGNPVFVSGVSTYNFRMQ